MIIMNDECITTSKETYLTKKLATANAGAFVQKDILEHIEGTVLYYPCSGGDLLMPMHLFAPYVTDFMFVDSGYFDPRNQDTSYYGLDLLAENQPPLLCHDEVYKLLDIHITVHPERDYRYDDVEYMNYKQGNDGEEMHHYRHDRDRDRRRYDREVLEHGQQRDHRQGIEPCTLSERYKHLPSSRSINIRRRRGLGLSAFWKEVNSMGVFFYRGDSMGEGGSGDLWLDPEHINNICNKLIDGGLIVTDGSQHGDSPSEYAEFWRYSHKQTELSGEEIVSSVSTFSDQTSSTGSEN